jgi:hypothetical protein
VLPFANDFDLGRVFKNEKGRQELEAALDAVGAARGPLRGVVAGGAPASGPAAAAGPGAGSAAAPRKRRTHREVAEDPDVKKVIEHTRGELVDFVERPPREERGA